MFKKISIFSLSLLMFSFFFFDSLNSNLNAKAARYPGVEIWKVEKVNKNYKTSSYGKWKLIYKGSPAKRKGEYDSISASISSGLSYSGNIEVERSILAASVGYSKSKEYTVSGSKNSAPLKKGEYVKGYAKKIGVYSKVTQRKYMKRKHSTKPLNEYKTAYVKKPEAISLKIDYYTSKNKKKKTVIYVQKSGSKKWVQKGKTKYYV